MPGRTRPVAAVMASRTVSAASGYGGAGDVVRDVRGDAQDVVAGLHEAVLDERLGAAGDLRLVEGAAVARHQVGAVAVRGEAHGAGVRDAHGDAVEVHGQADAEALDDLLDGGGEALPLDVRLGAGQQQEGRPGGVLDEPHVEGRLLVRPSSGRA